MNAKKPKSIITSNKTAKINAQHNQMGLLLLTKKLSLVYILQKKLSGILTCFYIRFFYIRHFSVYV